MSVGGCESAVCVGVCVFDCNTGVEKSLFLFGGGKRNLNQIFSHGSL